MALRFDRDRNAAITLTGGKRIHFPEDTYEIRLATLEEEREMADFYPQLELVEDERYDESESDLCGTIKTNGEPCDRLAEECRYHSQDDDSEDEDEEEADANTELDASDSASADEEEESSDDEEAEDEDEDGSESASYDYDL